MKQEAKLDISNHKKVEDMLQEKLANEILNEMTVKKSLQILATACQNEAESIIKNAKGNVLKELNEFRKTALEAVIAAGN